MKHETTLYLADDHQIIIDGLKLLLENEPSFIIIGSANDGKSAQNDILLKRPDIALIDLRMPEINGIQIINNLIKKVETKFIILSMHTERHYMLDSMNAGACGYLLKNSGRDELIICIQKILRNEKYFPNLERQSDFDMPYTLTEREMEILKLVLNELTTNQIAEQLFISPFTVETHRKNIWKKTNTKTLVGLIKYAIENGIEYLIR